MQEANQLAVGVLRSQLEQQGREDLVRAATEHREEMGEIRERDCDNVQIASLLKESSKSVLIIRGIISRHKLLHPTTLSSAILALYHILVLNMCIVTSQTIVCSTGSYM